MTAQPIFSTSTNQPLDETQVVVEHAFVRRERIMDPTYGLKTAAKKVHDAEAKKAQRALFEQQKAEVLRRQWTKDVSRKQALLDQTLADVATLERLLLDPKVMESRKGDMERTRVRLQKKADTIYDEIEALEAKLAPQTA